MELSPYANLSFSWHKVILVCFVAVLSYGAAKLGGTLIIGPQAEWPLWLGNAFLVSILLLVPWRMWPILIAAGFSASVLYNVRTGLTVGLSALLVLSDTVEVLAAALCLRYAFGGVPRLNNVRALAKFSLFGVILPPFIGAFCVALAANRNYWMSWRVYFFSEAIVYLTLVPAILGWFSKGSARRQKSRSYYLEAASLIAGLVAFGYVTFDASWRYSSQALLYSLVPFMLWSALRFGTTGVSASTIVIAVLALWGAAHGRGPFIESQLLNNVLSLQLFLFFTAAPFMVLAAVVEENRQASEQKLRASEERLAETTRLYGELQNREAKIRRLVEANVVGIAMWNLEGEIVEANEAFLHMVQYSREDLAAGRVRWRSLTPAEWRDRDSWAIAELKASGIFQSFEKEYFRKDGSRVPILLAGALFEESGNEGVAFVLDLTQQKRAEEALRRSEAYLAEAQKLTRTGSWHWNVTTGEVAWSQEYCAIFGFDFEKDKPSYQLFIERVHPEDRPEVEQVLWADVREKRDFDGEYRLLLPDGSIKYLHSLGKCSVGRSGDVEYIGAVVDITEHKRAERELRDSEERHRVVVEAASDAVISMDENGAILLANAAALRVFGYDPTELIGKPLTLLMPEYMRKPHEKGFKAYLATGERHINWQGTELTGLRKNGQEFPVEISFGELVKDGHRIFTGFIRDISERKRAGEALRLSEAHLSQAQRLAHVGSWVWGATEKETVYLSEEWYRVYGFEPKGGIPTWEERLQRVYPEDQAKWRAACYRAIDEKSDYDLEFRILPPDTPVRYVHSVGHPVFGSSGELVRFVGVSMDVTQSKQAEQAFRLLVVGTAATTGGDFFQSLVKHMAQALRARYAFVTTCDEQKHARTLAFWKGDRFGENFDFDIADTPCEKVLHGEVCRYRQGLQGLFPRDKFLADWQAESYLGVPMLDRSNRVIGHLAILDDKPMESDSRAIDLLKIFASRAAAELNRQKAEDELQAALQERERMREELAHLAHLNRVSTMGELAASLAHEIKQPISAAMTDARTCSRWLTRDCPDLAEAQAAASRVVKDVTRASEIIGRVRSLFKKDSLQHEEVDINEVIQEMIALLQGEASRHSILIHSDCSLDLPPIMADRVQLQQVLMNLMLNSIEAMKGMNTPGRLTIKSQQDDSGQLLISVMDTGVGVPAEKMDQIFNPFFTSKSEGTGMGLPISRSIIESHGGRLWADSNPESGSIFHFTLPTERTAHQAA